MERFGFEYLSSSTRRFLRVCLNGSRAPNADSAFSTLVDNCHPWDVG